MANSQPEIQAMEHLLAGVARPETERFQPESIHVLLRGSGEDAKSERVALFKTTSFPSIPGFGNACVAVYVPSAADADPTLPSRITDDMRHREVDTGILVRRPSEEDPNEMLEATRVTQSRRLSPSSAWAVELLLPIAKPDDPTEDAPDELAKTQYIPGVLAPTGIVKVYAPIL